MQDPAFVIRDNLRVISDVIDNLEDIEKRLRAQHKKITQQTWWKLSALRDVSADTHPSDQLRRFSTIFCDNSMDAHGWQVEDFNYEDCVVCLCMLKSTLYRMRVCADEQTGYRAEAAPALHRDEWGDKDTWAGKGLIEKISFYSDNLHGLASEISETFRPQPAESDGEPELTGLGGARVVPLQ